MGRFQCLFWELLSTNTCVNTYASAGEQHDSKCTKMNLSKTFCASHGTHANVSEPSFQHALVFLIKATIVWTKKVVSIPTASIFDPTGMEHSLTTHSLTTHSANILENPASRDLPLYMSVCPQKNLLVDPPKHPRKPRKVNLLDRPCREALKNLAYRLSLTKECV